MYIPFDALPQSARIWIYQADKKFSSEEKNIISEALETFSNQWLVHGKPIQASYLIAYDQFIILTANDETSGCSIDNSVRIIKSLGESLNINFFDRNRIAFKEKEEVKVILLEDLRAQYEAGVWNGQTLTFNNLITIKQDLEKKWIVATETTWLKRYVPKQTVTS